MKMLVFYRSREYTNAIISSTKAKLNSNKQLKGLEVDFINLDKRNYIKLLAQMEQLPRFVYIWFDEEKVTDYINENYPSIEVIHFDNKNSVEKHYDSWYGYSTREYKLVDLMIEKFKANLTKRPVFVVNTKDDYNILQEDMDDLDIASSKYEIFESKEDAKQYCIDSIKQEINHQEEKISDYEQIIKDIKATLRKRKALLKKFEMR